MIKQTAEWRRGREEKQQQQQLQQQGEFKPSQTNCKLGAAAQLLCLIARALSAHLPLTRLLSLACAPLSAALTLHLPSGSCWPDSVGSLSGIASLRTVALSISHSLLLPTPPSQSWLSTGSICHSAANIQRTQTRTSRSPRAEIFNRHFTCSSRIFFNVYRCRAV